MLIPSTTHAHKELSIVLKLIFFQVLNTSVASASFLLDSGDFNRAWYAQLTRRLSPHHTLAYLRMPPVFVPLVSRERPRW